MTFGQVKEVNKAYDQSVVANAAATKRCRDNLVEVGDGVISGVPVIGHIKGGIHYACGDKEGGDDCMKSASRTTIVAASAAGGFVCAGPPGAIAGAIAGGAAADGAITGVDSAIDGEFTPYG